MQFVITAYIIIIRNNNLPKKKKPLDGLNYDCWKIILPVRYLFMFVEVILKVLVSLLLIQMDEMEIMNLNVYFTVAG